MCSLLRYVREVCDSVFSYHMNVLVYPRLFAGSVLKQRSTFSGGHEKYYRVDLNLEPNITAAVHQTINTKDLIIVLGRPDLLNVLLRKKNGHELIMPRKQEMRVSDLNISSCLQVCYLTTMNAFELF